MRTHVALCVAASLLVSACQTAGPKQQVGTLGGALAGAAVGSQFGSGNGRLAAVLGGALLGGFLGNQIGAALDEADRHSLQRVTLQAARGGRSSHFHNKKTGVSGTARVTGTTIAENGRTCRTVEQEVTLPNNKISRDTVTACKGPNGWEV